MPNIFEESISISIWTGLNKLVEASREHELFINDDLYLKRRMYIVSNHVLALPLYHNIITGMSLKQLTTAKAKEEQLGKLLEKGFHTFPRSSVHRHGPFPQINRSSSFHLKKMSKWWGFQQQGKQVLNAVSSHKLRTLLKWNMVKHLLPIMSPSVKL